LGDVVDTIQILDEAVLGTVGRAEAAVFHGFFSVVSKRSFFCNLEAKREIPIVTN
jgi:hypothetical protein